jgi:hypothetical protein
MKPKATEIKLPTYVHRGRIDLAPWRSAAGLDGPIIPDEITQLENEVAEALAKVLSKDNQLKIRELAIKNSLKTAKDHRKVAREAAAKEAAAKRQNEADAVTSKETPPSNAVTAEGSAPTAAAGLPSATATDEAGPSDKKAATLEGPPLADVTSTDGGTTNNIGATLGLHPIGATAAEVSPSAPATAAAEPPSENPSTVEGQPPAVVTTTENVDAATTQPSAPAISTQVPREPAIAVAEPPFTDGAGNGASSGDNHVTT